MRQIRTILVPTDFSPPSMAALELGLQLARRFDSNLWLFHAYQLPVYPFASSVGFTPELAATVGDDARHALERLRDERTAGVNVHVATAMGSPAETIVEWAAIHGADLVVMGTHGRTGLKHLLAGSVAERVVRTAMCPVLTVRD